MNAIYLTSLRASLESRVSYVKIESTVQVSQE